MNQIQANIRVLSDDEIVRIHNTSMRILSEIGLHVPNETVCGMAQKLGVKVDGETVRIPAEALDPILALARAGTRTGDYCGKPHRRAGHRRGTVCAARQDRAGCARSSGRIIIFMGKIGQKIRPTGQVPVGLLRYSISNAPV